jgi:hypothetical protein
MVLKFLEKSCAYVFDKNDFNFDYEIPPAFDSGRPSNVCNEDDFDYAIELQEHEEYREVAANTSDIADFSEENILRASEATKESRKPKKKHRESTESIATKGRHSSVGSVLKKSRRGSTDSLARRRRRESMESIATFSSDAINADKKPSGHVSIALSAISHSSSIRQEESDQISTKSEDGSEEGGEDDENESTEEEESDDDDDDIDEEESSDDEDEEEEDEFDPSSDRRSFFQRLKERSFNKRMFLLSKRKRWVENQSRR